MADLEFPSPFEPSEEINADKSFGIISDQNGVSGRERSLNSFASSNGDINALKFAARDIRLSLASSERNTDDVINYLSKEIGEKGVESHLNQEQLQDALKDLQLENSINYNFNNGAKDEAGLLSASTSYTSLASELSEASNSTSNIVFPPISTPLPPPLSAADIPEHSPFEMMSPFEPNELPEPPQLPKKLSFSDAPYSLDDFIGSSPFEPTKYIAPLSLSSPRNITDGPQSDSRTELFSSSNSAANISTIGQPLSAPSSSQAMPIPNNNINNLSNTQPSSSPPISVVSVGGPRKFTLLKEFAPLSSSPPISFKQNPKSAPNSPRNEISASPEPVVKPSGRSNSLNSTYGSTSVSSSGSAPKRESGGNLSPVHENHEEQLMETIVVDHNRKSGWVTHRPAAKDNYTLGSHRKSTAVGATTVAQLNADANIHNRMTVKFSEPLRESNDKSRWQSVEKHENPKIGQENVRKQRKSLLTRSTSASSLPRNSVSREESPISNNANMGDKNQRKNSKTEPTSPLQMTKSESAIMKSDPVNSGGITAALSEAGLIGTISESNNSNTNEPEEKKPRRKSLIGKLTRTLSSTFKPLINSVKDMKEKSDPPSTSPASSSPSSLSSSPTSSSIKISSPPANEKRKKRSASDARNKKPILPVPNDRDRSQTVVAFTDMQRNGAYSANGIFGIPLDILYQQNDGVPDLINVCCGYLEQKALNLEGLFRISPTMTEVNQWKTDLTFESMHKLNDVDNPHVVASLLKQFFFDLPDPLFTDLLFKQFQDATDIENDTLRKIRLEELLKKLPEANYMVLQALVTFLRKVAKNSHENKMDARNLALVLSPSILRRKSAMFDVADLTKAKQHWMIIYDLIVNYDLIRDTPPKDYLPVD